MIGIIPARWASSRFPGKPLHPLCGKPLLAHVCERARECKELNHVVVATDDDRIREAAEGFGLEVVMTSPEHPTGTDRIAEAAARYPSASHFINIQGDEPLIDPTLVDELATILRKDESVDLITAASPLTTAAQLEDANIVKVVLNARNDALYFSRAAIPYPRQEGAATALRHIGLYGYRADFLQKFVSWPPAPLEIAESLEQLRALHHGACIRVVLTEHEAIGLDTPEQVSHLETLLARLHNQPTTSQS
ncbi:3-deoxy-manno-octulosonate cytidylyltransferase [Roseibacillus ishigakijimensis]|uniref:3-deoxy-manno-octulosonate cytidylyltransferase n=1 Tax=Roseibacillus ishigakijimensis TaxID=454146 RepID=A0A934VMQ6_9BACT|nr:3-deoxy-manno-octulosonate cytidylyltransferase [Roseibacillus ishigakijimensis]